MCHEYGTMGPVSVDTGTGALRMRGGLLAVFEFTDRGIVPLPETRFDLEGVLERSDLQRLLRDRIEILVPDVIVLAEEFASWDESRRRIDLLAIDRHANLVVVELKRGGDGFMDLQALRYAAMVSTMTFEQATAAHRSYLQARDSQVDAEEALLEFLGWDEPNEDEFGQSVQIVLAASEFSKELTTAVLWLNEHDLDIRCVRVQPYSWKGEMLLDVQQVIPLPEAAEYQVKVREKVRREREDRRGGRDLTKYDVTVDGLIHERLPKRRTMYQLVRHLCDHGISPEQIHEVLHWRGTGLWRVVADEVGSSEFIARATEAAEAGGPAFEPRRWFLADDELIVSGGSTYALTKMWGHRTKEAISALLGAFGDTGIAVSESDVA